MMELFDFEQPLPSQDQLAGTHFVGVGGIGMSAIARVLAARGVDISGSDARDSQTLVDLEKQGASTWVGVDPGRAAARNSLVVGTAIKADHPEVVAAQEAGLPIWHRSQALAAIMAQGRAICVAGTNGKTTTSSMLAAALVDLKIDPSFAIGGELKSTNSNGHSGASDVFVAEACESDRSFTNYSPTVAIVTNVQPDHLDFYGTEAAVRAAFVDFMSCVVPGGTLIVCADDDGAVATSAQALANRPDITAIRYGQSADADARVTELTTEDGAMRFVLEYLGERYSVVLPVPGTHNALNATAAILAAAHVGVSVPDAIGGVSGFSGTRRRFEFHADVDQIRVYDDYAHNPPKVAAVVETARSLAVEGRVVVVFQPHLYSRTQDFATEFGAALSGADHAVVMDVYPAREAPIPGVTGKLVADAISPTATQVHYEADADAALAAICALANPGDVVVTIGAGDVTLLAPQIVERLRCRGGKRES